MFTGVLHLVMTAYAIESPMAPGTALFGVLYVVLSIGLFADKRIFNYLGAIITVLGITTGIYAYLAISPEPIIIPMAIIDIAIILFCIYLILQKKP